MARLRSLLPAIALALACKTAPPERVRDCADAACRLAWADAAWTRDQADAIAQIRAMPDPLARSALVLSLSEQRPGQTGQLCLLLESGDTRVRCQALNNRPHLRGYQMEEDDGARSSREAKAPQRPGDGPLVIPGLEIDDAALHLWDARPPAVAACETTLNQCQSAEALRRADAGDTDGAAAACLGIEAGTWREECFFSAAERAVENLPADRAGGAADLCRGAGSYASQCALHLVWRVGAHAPSAGSGADAAWTRVQTEITQVGLAFDRASAGLGGRWRDQAWANALRYAYEKELTLTGRPLAALPTEIAPYVRAGAAWRLWNLEGQQTRTLTAWTARLEELLASTAAPHPPPGLSERRPNVLMRNYFNQILPEEQGLQVQTFLGGTRRAVSSDPSIDAAIVMLESFAQGRTDTTALLRQGLSHADPLVRWTAVRLLRARNPNKSEVGTLVADPDPAVRARARVSGNQGGAPPARN